MLKTAYSHAELTPSLSRWIKVKENIDRPSFVNQFVDDCIVIN